MIYPSVSEFEILWEPCLEWSQNDDTVRHLISVVSNFHGLRKMTYSHTLILVFVTAESKKKIYVDFYFFLIFYQTIHCVICSVRIASSR